jgi:hypothetical protein
MRWLHILSSDLSQKSFGGGLVSRMGPDDNETAYLFMFAERVRPAFTGLYQLTPTSGERGARVSFTDRYNNVGETG